MLDLMCVSDLTAWPLQNGLTLRVNTKRYSPRLELFLFVIARLLKHPIGIKRLGNLEQEGAKYRYIFLSLNTDLGPRLEDLKTKEVSIIYGSTQNYVSLDLPLRSPPTSCTAAGTYDNPTAQPQRTNRLRLIRSLSLKGAHLYSLA